MRLLTRLLLAFSLLFAGAAFAQPVRTEHTTIDLIVKEGAIAPGQPFTAGVRLRMIPHWHTYWVNPGDAGLAATIDWKLPAGFTTGAIQWPYPTRLKVPGATNFGYEGEVTLPVRLVAPPGLQAGSPVTLKAHVAWLVCAEVCVPEDADVAVTVPVAAVTGAPDPANAASFGRAEAAQPRPAAAWTFRAERSPTGFLLVAEPQGGAVASGTPTFFPLDESVVENGADQPLARDGGRIVATVSKASYADKPAERLRGVWVMPGGWQPGVPAATVDVAIGPPGSAVPAGAAQAGPTAAPSSSGFAGTLALAFLGGLILNLMPCVFPVLGLKIVGFVNQAGSDRRKVVAHGLAFTAGVLISFWLLAGLLAVLRAGGTELGWGFQLQSPGFVFALAAVLLLFALNLSGAFEFGVRATAIGSDLQGRAGLAGTFFTGFLATVVATPCSAPFLAPALGAAVVLPPVQSFLAFTVIGLGLSAPYLILSAFPALVRFLPRPGAWMETFKQLMAFPLYATAAYLLWVLAGQVEEEALLTAAWGLVAIAAAAWAYGRWTRPEAKPGRAGVGYGMALALAAGGLWLGWPRSAVAGAQEVVWEKWSPAAVARLQGEGRIVYVDFTARWCATCQTNKALVFHSDAVLKRLADRRVALLRADWTNRDPAITAELARWSRSAIPFNLVYTPGRPQPTILPEVLTPDVVLKAIG